VVLENLISTCKRLKLDSLHPIQKSAQMDQNLHLRSETLKSLEENVMETLQDIGLGKEFLNRTSIAQEVRARIEKCDLSN
jgi:hypothetical protein